jgi:hypothetical protein
MYKRNIEARSRNHCCRGKSVSTVELGYNDIGLCDTSSIASDILWCQLISHC